MRIFSIRGYSPVVAGLAFAPPCPRGGPRRKWSRRFARRIARAVRQGAWIEPGRAL